jgi:hypothetical protein
VHARTLTIPVTPASLRRMPDTYLPLLAWIAYATAAALAAFFLLRARDHRVVGAVAIALVVLRFAAIFWIDLEPFGRPSTFRTDGTPLPAWLLALATFLQFAFWGALGAWLGHPARRAARAKTPAGR